MTHIAHSTVKRWGNSLATRLPKHIAEACNLEYGQEIELKAKDGQLVITPIENHKSYSLEELLAASPRRSVKRDAEDNSWFNDAPVGREVW